MDINHTEGCTEQNRIGYPCFACHMESEKEKYGDSVQFFSGDTLSGTINDDGILEINEENPHENSYKNLSPEYWFNKVQWDMDKMPDDKRERLSDGFHSFKELYDHRIALFIALCNNLVFNGSPMPWKSMRHEDGTMWEGWFIAGIGTLPGETLTYHLPIMEWDNLNSGVIDIAPEWDGHTSDDVLRLLRQF